MTISLWIVIGMIVGVLGTSWLRKLSLSRLILFLTIGSIGSVSGGVIGYLMYGASLEWFDLSVFSISFISLLLVTIIRRRFQKLYQKIYQRNHPILLLPERSTMSLKM